MCYGLLRSILGENINKVISIKKGTKSIKKMFKKFAFTSNKFAYLESLPKISLFRASMREAAVFTLFLQWLI